MESTVCSDSEAELPLALIRSGEEISKSIESSTTSP